MNINEFRSEAIEFICNNNEDINVCEIDTLKNNGLKLCGIAIRRGDEKIVPTIYLENFYKDYEYGVSIEAIADQIMELSEKSKYAGEFDETHIMDYERIKEKIFIKLINTNDNAEMLNDLPHRHFIDMSMIAYVDIGDICGMNATFTVKKEHIQLWGVSEEELLDFAYNNTKKQGYTYTDIGGMVNDMIRRKNNCDRECEITELGRMFVMRSEKLTFSAVCMTYDDVLDEFIKDRCDGVYILPSSIYEIILVPDRGEYTENDFSDIVKDVNKCAVDLEDRLSSNAYYYNSENGYSIV